MRAVKKPNAGLRTRGATGTGQASSSKLPAAICRPVDQRPALTTQLAVACLGAGVITSFAVAQGQNPFTALGITLFSAVAAVMVGQVL